MKKYRMILSAAIVAVVLTTGFAFTPKTFSGQCLFQKNTSDVCVLVREVSSGSNVSDIGAIIAKPANQECEDVAAPSACSSPISYNNEP